MQDSSGTPKAPAKQENWFVHFSRAAGGVFSAAEKFDKEEYSAALAFLDWNLKPREVNAATLLATTLCLCAVIPAFGFVLYSYFFLGQLTLQTVMYAGLGCVIAPILAAWYFQSYIIRAAEAERMSSITHIPEIVNYLVMSMKLSPNLERAVEFASTHGRGKIAEELKNIVWGTHVGAYLTIEEGLDKLAYKWGKYSEEFKHALMLIRSSVIESDEAARSVILDKAVTDTLDSIRDNMDKYAIKMRQPSIYLYYVGVLLPLMLIVMLPIGSIMARLPLGQTWIMILLYNVGIPIGAVFFATTILQNRPPSYIPPKIPDDFPGLPRPGMMKLGSAEIPAVLPALLAAAAIFIGFYMFVEPAMNPLPPAYAAQALAAHFPFFTIAGAATAFCVFLAIWFYGTACARRKVQLEVVQMEKEFQDSIYVVASRLGENRPLEEAITYSASFLAGTKIAKVYQHAADNITNLGMTAEAAFFDPAYGALKNVPSEQIRGSIRIVIDSIQLGVQQAARALVSMSLQLRDSQKVKDKIASLLEEITSMMKSIAFLIAPLVLGITTALQKIVISALKSVGSTTAAGTTAPQTLGSGTMMSSFGDPTMLNQIPDASTFLLILAAFVVEITLILIYFTSKIEEGDNSLAFRINAARSLPIAIVLFFASAWFASKITVA